jgi:hypothetical protein
LLQWIQGSIDRKEAEVPLPSPKDEEKYLTDGSHTKDRSLESYLAVGLICLIVGYFGWIERSQKQLDSERFDELIALGTKGAKTFPDMDQASQVAVHKAHQIAASVLAETTKSSIKEMEKQLEVPRHLLISSPVKGTKVSPPEIIEPDTGDQFLKSLIGINKLKKALSAKDGYLFRPGQESMGKIMDIKQGKGGILFKRADRSNSGSRFSLSVANYEIRIGSQEEGFVVLTGSVTKLQKDKDYAGEEPVYLLEPSKAWWLDQDQIRTELDLILLDIK